MSKSESRVGSTGLGAPPGPGVQHGPGAAGYRQRGQPFSTESGGEGVDIHRLTEGTPGYQRK